MKNEFNNYIRRCSAADGIIDFDRAVRDTDNNKAFALGCDSGDHLHPSAYGYEVMAQAALEYICKG